MMKLIFLSLLFEPGAFAASPLTVIYEVPATDALTPFASFEVPYAVKEGPGNTTELTYTLPATLLGQARTFTVSGLVNEHSSSFALHGSDADMSCENKEGSALCRVTHHKVSIDLVGVKAALEQTTLSPVEKQGHLELASFAAREGGDLVGVMNYARGVHY